MTNGGIKYHVDIWRRKIIFQGRFVDISKVGTHFNHVIWFNNNHNILNPRRIINRMNKASFQEFLNLNFNKKCYFRTHIPYLLLNKLSIRIDTMLWVITLGSM